MGKEKIPVTTAIRELRERGVDHVLHSYHYEEKGGTEVAAKGLNVDEHAVIKTLVMEDEKGDPFLILMHGDRQVSTKALARELMVKMVRSCAPEVATRHTGYVVGGISPFGTKKSLTTYVEESILSLPMVYINAGKRGLLAEMPPGELIRILNPKTVNVGI